MILFVFSLRISAEVEPSGGKGQGVCGVLQHLHLFSERLALLIVPTLSQ